MFDFEKLEVYQKTRELNSQVLSFLFSDNRLDPWIRDQWKRATISAALNISEGSARTTMNDKQNFITIARSSVFESVAIMEIVKTLGGMDEEKFRAFYAEYETISKMLLGMIRSFSR